MTEKKPIVIERRKPKKKKKVAPSRIYNVEIIPKTIGVYKEDEAPPKQRVAAYCRVSTEEEAQSSSFELQVKYYTEYIEARDDWVLAGIYADEGISGTQIKHRDQFNQMIADCVAGKIDMIITKSISRFARNVLDCLSTIQKLKELKPPIGVFFQKENMNSLDEKATVFLTMLASFAQEESRSISTNIRWAIRKRMQNGTQKFVTASLYGYDTDEDGNVVIVRQEAEIVQKMYAQFLKGRTPGEIARSLNMVGVRTIYDNEWTSTSVKSILQNEKYCGDVIMQKTITVDYLTHKSKRNDGEEDKFYIPDHHEAIIDREAWNRVQELLAAGVRKRRRKQQRLIPIRKGVLLGFVPINPRWNEVSWTRLENATQKVMAKTNEPLAQENNK